MQHLRDSRRGTHQPSAAPCGSCACGVPCTHACMHACVLLKGPHVRVHCCMCTYTCGAGWWLVACWQAAGGEPDDRVARRVCTSLLGRPHPSCEAQVRACVRSCCCLSHPGLWGWTVLAYSAPTRPTRSAGYIVLLFRMAVGSHRLYNSSPRPHPYAPWWVVLGYVWWHARWWPRFEWLARVQGASHTRNGKCKRVGQRKRKRGLCSTLMRQWHRLHLMVVVVVVVVVVPLVLASCLATTSCQSPCGRFLAPVRRRCTCSCGC